MTLYKLTAREQYRLQIAKDMFLYNNIIMDGFTLDKDGEIWFEKDYS